MLESNGQLSGVKVEELFDNEVYVSVTNGVLSVWLDFDSGSGSWNAITTSQTVEPWFVSTTGTVDLDGQSMDIESAAEHFAATLVVD